MYGTVMIGRLAVPFEQVESAVAAWATDKGIRTPGYLGQTALLADDGVTSVACIRFADEASYRALSDDPEQSAWWSDAMAPLFEGEVQWIDGHWHD
jgi:antibiotic biosynthesis monooxygenase (ABM) superfamily enzyme